MFLFIYKGNDFISYSCKENSIDFFYSILTGNRDEFMLGMNVFISNYILISLKGQEKSGLMETLFSFFKEKNRLQKIDNKILLGLETVMYEK